MNNGFVFHIRNAQPGDLAALLATLDAHSNVTTIQQIVEHAEAMGFSILDRTRLEALATAKDLGLVKGELSQLTEDGSALAQLEMSKPDLFADIVHGLQYALWNEQIPGENCFSWSYRALCQLLWRSGSTPADSRVDLASQVEAEARRSFNRSDIAFSAKSIGGALLWLSQLRPEVILAGGERFERRSFCPPELVALAADFVYQDTGVDYGSNLLLNDERREALSQFCLLEPTGLDRVLEYAVAQFDLLEKGLGGGWGHYLTLHRKPHLRDFV